jgi:mono/diheme cytochrome c family protein
MIKIHSHLLLLLALQPRPAAPRAHVEAGRAVRIAWSLATLGAMGDALAQGVAQPATTSTLVVVARPYDLGQLLARPSLSEAAQKGRVLWLQRCAYCHDGVGQPTYRTMGPWLGAETVRTLGPDALRAIIGAGTVRMPGFRYGLRAQQVDQLIEFLKTVDPEQKPTAVQLAGRSSGAAASKGGE